MPEENIILTPVEEFEFPEEADMEAFWANPSEACEGMQRKYIGMTPSEFEIYFDNIQDAQEAEPWVQLVNQTFTNPYTHESKTVLVKVAIPQPDPMEVIAKRIEELKLKLVNWTITPEEREELALLK